MDLKQIKCECGHVNPEGTILCEACGKPIEGNQHLDGNEGKKLLNMRYDGTARRSQTYNKSFIDKTWSFFSSVKVGVWLIVITLIASGIGTIYPQEQYIPAEAVSRDPAVFYESQYGMLGKIYYQLGFHNLYSSWWYMLLVALIGVSLVICSLDRFVPLYKALKKQKPKRHVTFIKRQRFYSETEDISNQDIEKVKGNLKKQRYRVSEQNGHILAEKGRFSRWGPYVNHIGLIIILLAALLRTTSFFYLDEYVWIREGEQKLIPGTDGEYYIENKQFILETYDENDARFKEALKKKGEPIASNYQTDVVLYKKKENSIAGVDPELEKVKEEEIRLNHPLKFSGYTLYQSGYQLNEFHSMTFDLRTNDSNEKSFGSFTINLTNPQSEYELDDGYRVKMEEYYPDYDLVDGKPKSVTNFPRNPAFVFLVYPPNEDKAEISFVGIGKNIDATGTNQYKLKIQDFDMRNASGLTVRRDYTLPIFALGAIIFMIGVIQGMYWQHRRIWLHPVQNNLLLAAHTNKNWYGLRKDIEKAIADTSICQIVDQQEKD